MNDVDVVVAGAGGAGCAAALAASGLGKSVLLIDAKTTYRRGSNTAMSTSMIPAGGSRWQAQQAIVDSPTRFLADVMAKTKGAADATVAQVLTTVAPDVVAWLADECGVQLELPTDFNYPGHSVQRCHSVADRSGATLLGQMHAEVARRTDRITLGVPLRLVRIVEDQTGVIGITVENPDGEIEEIATEQVVLATNGFGARPEIVSEHIPSMADALYFGGEGSFGDAIDLGAELGADIRQLDAYQGHGSVAHPHGILVTWAAIMHGAIMVNRDGLRFGDESVGYSEYAVATLAQPGGIAWMILDERIDAACRPFKDYQDLIEAGALRRASNTAALAGIVGSPTEVLQQTLEQASRSARTGEADGFGRTDWEAALGSPYLAVKVTGALFHTQGGLAVDETATVLRGGNPIRGLYAAGGAAVGMSGNGADGYLAGNGLLAALGLGYIAGQSVGAV